LWYGWSSMITKEKDSKGTIQKKVLIKASPEIIFQALTEARDLVRWFCDRATSDPREGGELTAYWRTAGQKGRAIFRRFVPGSQLEMVWVDDGEGIVREDASHSLAYSIKVKRGTSEVTMNDSDYPPPDPDTFSRLDQGWNSVLLELKDYCERKERSARHPEAYREE
jgi:uncharacterized protein YndB with AHSA1/START domain